MTARPDLIASAERAWELRGLDPERSAEMAGEIAMEAGRLSMPDLGGIAGIILHALRLARQGTEEPGEEIAGLESLLRNEPLWRARLHHLQGLSHTALARYAAALEGHGRALAIFEELGDRAGIADALNGMAVAQYSLGEFPEALEYNHRALQAYEAIGDRAGMARSSTQLGAVLMYLGDLPGALLQLERAIAIGRESGQRRELARALNNMGVVHLEMGDYPVALENHNRAMAIREEIGDQIGIAASLLNIGNVYNALGDYSAALEYFRRSLAIKEERGDRAGIANSLNNIGNASMSLGDSATALEQFARSLEIWEQLGNRSGEASSLHNLGYVHFELGEYRTAVEYYRRSIAIEEEIGVRSGVADSLNNIGNVHMILEEHAAALEHYQSALAIYEEIGEPNGIAASLSNIGNVHLTLGNHAAALEHGIRTLSIREEMGDRAGIVESLVNIGTAMLELGESDRAIGKLEEALAIAVDLGGRGIIAEAHNALVTAFERTGRHREALEHLREYVRITGEIRSEEARTALHQMEVRHRVAEAEKEAEIERLRNVELAEALRQLKATQAQLVQSEKMAGIGQLTAGIAHEINNPINYVSASLPSLLRDLAELDTLVSPNPGAEEEAADVIEEMRLLLASSLEGARRVAAIVAGLRSFSRLDEGERKPVDLHDGLEATIALLGAKLDGKITIDREYGALPAVECYPGEINQVFMNLLANAIDAIETEGTITIATTADDAMARIAITDTGRGIATENIERIFDPFFTTKEIGKGTGLGLAIAYGIITKHGGEITVTSAPDAGSTFTLTLPLSFPLSPRPTVPPSPTLPLAS